MREISIRLFIKAIGYLPEDPIQRRPGIWYRSQKQHWLGWLKHYHGPGAYGRRADVVRDAKFAYNHAVNPGLLMYLVHAIPLDDEVIDAAERAAQSGSTMMSQPGAIHC